MSVVPIGLGAVRIDVSCYGTDAMGDPAAQKMALGYVQNLSKRTMLYLTWARLRNRGSTAFGLNGAIVGPSSPSTGMDFGIRHTF